MEVEDESTVTTLNLNKVCRACLTEFDEMHSIFSRIQYGDDLDEKPTFLCEILMSISSIRILAEDSLPSMICTNCMELANAAYKFQQQCNQSQEILEAYLMQLQLKETETEEPNEEDADERLPYFDSGLSPINENDSMVLHLTVQDDLEKVVEETCINITDENSNGTNNSEECPLVDTTTGDSPLQLDVNDESLLNAVIIKSIENTVQTQEELVVEELPSDSDIVQNNNGLVGQPAIGFNYYVKMNEKGQKLYECNYCGKVYKHSSTLKVHVRTHTLERSYVCTHCGKGFQQYRALSYHLRSHTGEQPYTCKLCGKKYRQSGTLTAHMRVHTGQKPFLCSVCGRGFRQAPDLGYHMRTHTKERPYMCNVCGKTMRMQCHLVQHMRIHTGEKPFQCGECNKAFPSSTRLKRHAIIHTGLKPYTCDICQKSFNRLSSLKVHAKIHTDERPHVCSVCGKGFIQAHALRAHLQTHSLMDNFDDNCI